MTRTIDTLNMFDDCVIPGCVNPVIATGDVCQPCRTAFGRYLTFRPDTQPPTTTPTPAPAPGDRPRGESKANQRCWLCEQRRTCTQQPRGWECTTCHAVT